MKRKYPTRRQYFRRFGWRTIIMPISFHRGRIKALKKRAIERYKTNLIIGLMIDNDATRFAKFKAEMFYNYNRTHMRIAVIESRFWFYVFYIPVPTALRRFSLKPI